MVATIAVTVTAVINKRLPPRPQAELLRPLATYPGPLFGAGEDSVRHLRPHSRAPQPGQTHSSKARGQQGVRQGASGLGVGLC